LQKPTQPSNSKLLEGASLVRHVLVESAHTAVRLSDPLGAFDLRVRARRGHAIAIVATARKMAKVFWHLLACHHDYAYSLPSAMSKKIRTIELSSGEQQRPRRRPRPDLDREQRREIDFD
jgi:transposase